ncbi:MAG: ssDNA-binding domain-containing protein [Bacteroidales bacterium]|nr:ssDNA-binding domain-containing protein [Bacteroidales bacterium]
MKYIEKELVKRFSDYYLSVLTDRIVAKLDQISPDAMEGGASTQLVSLWEEICVQVQGEYFDIWESYETFYTEISFTLLEHEKPEVLNLLAYSICLELEIEYIADENPIFEIAAYIFEDMLERAANDDREAIQQFLEAKIDHANKISTFKAKFEEEAKIISDRIIQQIEEGAGKFEMPWHKGLPFALNRFTGNMYSGMNQLRLWEACQHNNYSRNYWATFYQWRKLGGNIITGSKSTKIGVVFERKIQNDSNQLPIPNMIAAPHKLKKYMRFFSVLNMDQVSGHHFDKPDLFTPTQNSLEAIKDFIDRTKAKIKLSGTRAFYKPAEDFIQMPFMARFKDENNSNYREAYYAVLFHELIHWTGHQNRCSRNNSNPDRKFRYAFEELVAELGSAMLSSYFNQKVYPRSEHAQYIEIWLGVLKKDFKYFYQAQNQAITAINWLFVQTNLLPFDIKKRPICPINDDRFDNWENLYNSSNHEVDTALFTQSII